MPVNKYYKLLDYILSTGKKTDNNLKLLSSAYSYAEDNLRISGKLTDESIRIADFQKAIKKNYISKEQIINMFDGEEV